MWKSLIVKVVIGVLVGVLVSVCVIDEDVFLVNSVLKKMNKVSEIWFKLDIEVKLDFVVEKKVLDIFFIMILE